ncbi:cytochrome P460 family protein [Frateuria sp. GZRR33]|uniref:cytochrome P460 family protein n=1 Tax=Frateuria sp. GZRR33 TaxID=3351535 RepID=UPI003EDC4BA9
MLAITRYLPLAVALALAVPVSASETAASRTRVPVYTADGELVLPSDYREWVFLSAGLGMSYSEKAPAGEPTFDNTFVDPESYREFVRTGTWPDKTQIVLEMRDSTSRGSINRHGYYQRGGAQDVEVHVKDTARFSGWAFFGFDGKTSAKRIPQSAPCYACHAAHGAVDTTFVQFYPTLLPLARQHATLSAAFLEDEGRTIK